METFQNYGNQTWGENIADTMALQTVFRAYKRRERVCKKEDPVLPGLERFSNDQLFFLSSANVSLPLPATLLPIIINLNLNLNNIFIALHIFFRKIRYNFYLQLWCETVQNKDIIMHRAKYDVHSTARLRTIGSMSNSEDFARAFKCPVGSPMNPENKCNIWE